MILLESWPVRNRSTHHAQQQADWNTQQQIWSPSTGTGVWLKISEASIWKTSKIPWIALEAACVRDPIHGTFPESSDWRFRHVEGRSIGISKDLTRHMCWTVQLAAIPSQLVARFTAVLGYYILDQHLSPLPSGELASELVIPIFCFLLLQLLTSPSRLACNNPSDTLLICRDQTSTKK